MSDLCAQAIDGYARFGVGDTVTDLSGVSYVIADLQLPNSESRLGWIVTRTGHGMLKMYPSNFNLFVTTI